VSHREQILFVEMALKHLRKYYPRPNVVEIGSYNFNGSIRGIVQPLSPSRYTGVDLMEGPGVDLICSGHEVNLPTNFVDICISCECFEHNTYWVETFNNMTRMTKDGGCVIVSCASRGRIEHGTYRSNNPGGSPGTALAEWEYYKNITQKEFEGSLALAREFDLYSTFYSRSHRDLYFIGIKSGGNVSSKKLDFERAALEIKGIGTLRRKEMGLMKTAAHEIGVNIPIGVMSNLLAHDEYQCVALQALRFKRFLRRLSGSAGKR
jgi:hypothetical protein